MKRVSISVVVITAILVSACTPPALQGSEQSLGSAITVSKVPLTASLSLSERIDFEQRLAQDSIAFLSSKPNVKADFKCSTDGNTEIVVARARLITFEAIELHFKNIQGELSNNFDATKIAAEAKAIKDAWENFPIAPRGFSNHLQLIQGVLEAAAKAINSAQAQRDYTKHIPERARKFSGELKKVVNDLKSGLAKSKIKMAAYITTWKTCEYERLKVLYSRDNVNPVEIASLFEAYRTKAANFEKENDVIIGDDKIFDKMIQANDLLYAPKVDWEYAKKFIAELTDRLKEYQAVKDELKKISCAQNSTATLSCSAE